ncbi:hypothetical protein BU15DRAFT_47243 [Melanogaster broomeanus]|nr:hypothetical protein BU15DRAFT_47243 [Melanogaster broomeanus]
MQYSLARSSSRQFVFSDFRYIHISSARLIPENQSASAKLFADAAREEAEEAKATAADEASISKLTQLESQQQNWTGEESLQDAVLRMLVDKYRPLRTGPIRTADQKLKDSPPQIRPSSQAALPQSASANTRSWQHIANEPLLPGIEGHRPWHATYTAPSHVSASIKLGNFSPSTARSSTALDDADEQTRRTERELARRRQKAIRLTRARESTLDYRLGLKSGGDGQTRAPTRINPVSLKGWQSLIEDRIEKARLEGQFDKVKGRGKPIAWPSEERNPFIAREEFLMNRIVQRNGAAPPWVEVQIELEAAVNSFREAVRQSWTRRAIRTLTVSQPAALLPSLSLSMITSLRDREWEERERSYHDAAIAELNSLVRKYNAVAPYAVRRPYYARDSELAEVYRDCGEEILRGIAKRSQELPGHPVPRFNTKLFRGDEGVGGGIPLRLRDLIIQWLQRLRRRFTKAG